MNEIIIGEKFSNLTVISIGGIDGNGSRLALFKCDCGVIKLIQYSRVKKLRAKTCGCSRLGNPNIIKNLVNRTGIPMVGRGAKSSKHHKSKFWQLKTPDGAMIEGVNLNQLVRDNISLFSPLDVIWIGERCHASHGIRHLFDIKKDGGLRNNSWKGWQIGDKMKISEMKGIAE
jgi:hypothetical protein